MEKDYLELLIEIKQDFEAGRLKAVQAVNVELINLYYNVGKKIIARQAQHGWGKSIVERLSKDLRLTFPGSTGFSSRNLWDMRRFYERYSPYPNLRQAVAEIPWGHHLLILNKTNEMEEATFYIKQTSKNGWSRNVLLNFIKSDSYQAGLKKTNRIISTQPCHLILQNKPKRPLRQNITWSF